MSIYTTVKQRKAFDKIVENGGNVSKAMRDVGYTKATATTPKKLTQSRGYKELLKEYGLTEGLITKALVADIKGKPRRRIKELELGADILQMRKREIPPENNKPIPILAVINNIQINTNGVSTNNSNQEDTDLI